MDFDRKYVPSLTLGALEIQCEAHEQLHGEIRALTTIGKFTIATYGDDAYPAAGTLGFLPMIGASMPPTPPGATPLFAGQAFVMNQPMALAVFRTH